MEARVLQHEDRGSGDPLVLVPGGLSGWVSWAPYAERFAATRRTIRVQPIHNEMGSAGVPGDLSYDTTIERESLRMTLDSLGVSRADFAGWSGGGRALLEFGMEYPERLRTLTLIEPAAYWILEQLGEVDDELLAVNEFMHGIAGKTVTEDDLAQFLVHAGFARTIEESRAGPMWERSLPHRQALSWSPPSADHPDRKVDELASIACPVLLVRGRETAAWLSRVVDRLAEILPDTTVLDLPGDHACHLQNPELFLPALDAHLS